MSTTKSTLNKEQQQAVTHPPNVPLQILAGPGSGKTKVLTARVQHLVQQIGVPPSSICAVTFTNKAANEMRERLGKLIGAKHTDVLIMGTFHALCAKFLRKYGSCISLPNNFTICDAEESKKLISKILKGYTDELASNSIQMKEAAVLSSISKAKAKGLSPHQFRNEKTSPYSVQNMIARIYADYSALLKENNSLDFDDLLVSGVRLFTKEPKTVAWCRHVLVDEFQDTNSVQYELMVCLAAAHRCVTVVGDPDQSIYGWRSAEVTNLGRMHKDFPTTQQIFLEQNYRSTGSILAAALAIVAQDKSRIAKSLRTFRPPGALPTLQTFATEQAEAAFVAGEIKRLIAHSGGMLGWNDFVILLRFNALSRVIEAALQKEGIPNRVLAGQKFFERLEIKDVLAYLQVIDNPSYTPAFNRAAHTPPRGLGEKSISELESRAKKLGLSSMELAERIFAGRTSDIKPPVKRKLESFVKPILMLRKMANEGTSVPDLIRRLLVQIDYEGHLKKNQQDWEARWENVQELINYASQFEDSPAENVGLLSDPTPGTSTQGIDPDHVGADEYEESESTNRTETPLRVFLQASMLSTGTEAKNESQTSEKVTISTCHSAKGLEWPVVFVPAVEKGTFPFYRTEDVEEERRLLYVACTRAQGFLYLSSSTRRMTGGEWTTKELSEFVSVVAKKYKALFTSMSPTITGKDRGELANLLGRKSTSEEDVVQLKLQEYNQTTRPYASTTDNPSRDFECCLPPPLQVNGTSASFTSARVGGHMAPSTSNLAPTKHCFPLPPITSLPGTGTSFLPASSTARPVLSMRVMGVPVSPSLAPHAGPTTSLSSLQAAASDSLASMKTLGLPNTTPSGSTQLSLKSNLNQAGQKRKRLGMGRLGTGYTKKVKEY